MISFELGVEIWKKKIEEIVSKKKNRFVLTNFAKKKIEKEFSIVIDKDLFNATKEGDIEKVKIALESGGVSPDAHLSLNGKETHQPLLSIAAEVRFSLIEK